MSSEDAAVSICVDQVLAKISENKQRILAAMHSHDSMIELIAIDTEFTEGGQEIRRPFDPSDLADGYKIVKSCMAIALYYLSLIEEKKL